MNKTKWWIWYKNYLNSPEWKKKSKKWREETNSCEKCDSKYRLVCHHKNYKNVGCETRKDVIILCGKCHWIWHKRIMRNYKTKRIKDRIEKLKEISKKDRIWKKVNPFK